MSATIDGIEAILIAAAEMHAYERANPFDRDVMRARWAGVAVDEDAGKYIDAATDNEGPRRWIREECIRAAFLAWRTIVTLADVIPIVWGHATANPSQYYHRDRLIVGPALLCTGREVGAP
jgi:hypothetical protein